MRMRNFWAQNDPLSQMRIFFRKPVNEPFSFHSCLSTCQKSKSDNNLFLKYWRLKNTENLIGREPFFAITWEPDFSKACGFRRMLMNRKNFHFTQIPDKTNDVISFVIFAQLCFFPKNPAVTHNYIWAPNTILSFRKN